MSMTDSNSQATIYNVYVTGVSPSGDEVSHLLEVEDCGGYLRVLDAKPGDLFAPGPVEVDGASHEADLLDDRTLIFRRPES